MTNKPPFKTDIAVLMLFFNRPQMLAQVFAQVRAAKPSQLFLYQDGPRSEADMPAILACREIVEYIDWECRVERNYRPSNQGCDPSGFLAQQWAFSLADKVMVLEDDVVPAQSFFPFCKEMLDRYEHDPRIGMIAGFNIDSTTTDISSSYFFTSAFSIWGWASWRRVVKQWDGQYTFVQDKETMAQLTHLARHRRLRSDFITMLRHHAASGKPYFESIFWSHMLRHNQLAIMPAQNQITNIGATAQSTHYQAELATMPRRLRQIFTMPRHEMTFPLRHPSTMIEHTPYIDRLYRVNAWNHPWIKITYSLEELFLNLLHARFAHILQALTRRCNKWLGRERHK